MLGFIECSLKKSCSYSQWAAAIGRISGCSVSRQSLFERLNEGASAFAEKLLQHALKKQVIRHRNTSLLKCFRRVLLQDSTTLCLHDTLSASFPGNKSRGIQKAVARIQCIMEITAMRFIHFSLSGFTQNDQSASPLISSYIGKGDLIIRDLGYFVLNSLQEVTSKQAFFLSRLRYNVKVYNCKGECLSIQRLLSNRRMDQWVWIGEQHRLPVRLVMVPLPAAQAAERIRKARTDRDKRLNHSKAYYQWLQYAAFITNVDEQVWTTRQVTETYKVRWQIEIVFKSWKSAFNLQYIVEEPYRNVHRIRTAILLMLLFICLFIQKIYLYYQQAVQKRYNKTVSLLKLSKYTAANLIVFFIMNRYQLLEQVASHCCYDKRTDRTNMTDLIYLFKKLS